MAYQLTDKITAPSRLTAEEAWAIAQDLGAARPVFTKELIFKAYELCQHKGWDFANMFAQMANETGNFKSDLYKVKGNPGGIGKTGTDTSTGVDLSRNYATGSEAAYAMAVHTHVYTEGAIDPDDELYPYIYLDPRYNAALIAKDVQPGSQKLMAGTVKTLGDWNVNGRWAELNNSKYGNNIIQRGNEIAARFVENQTTEGTPPVAKDPLDLIRNLLIEAYVDKQEEGQGFDYGTRKVIGIVQHETQGEGSGWWYQEFFSCPGGERCGNALVDYLIDRSGKIYQFQDPFTSNRIPWASGGTPNRNNPIGKAVNDKYGNVNKYYAAVEVVKSDDSHMNDAQIEATARLTAYIMVRCGYPANDWKYPDSLGGNIATSCNHADLSLTTCQQFADDRAKFEARVTALLADFYGTSTGGGTTGGDPPAGGGTTPPKPSGDAEIIVDGLDWGVFKRLWGTKFPNYVPARGGPLTKLYLERAKKEGQWPSLAEQYNYGDGRRYFQFSNGWLALDPPGDGPNQKVRWVVDEKVEPAG
jgi:hypothetical protein